MVRESLSVDRQNFDGDEIRLDCHPAPRRSAQGPFPSQSKCDSWSLSCGRARAAAARRSPLQTVAMAAAMCLAIADEATQRQGPLALAGYTAGPHSRSAHLSSRRPAAAHHMVSWIACLAVLTMLDCENEFSDTSVVSCGP